MSLSNSQYDAVMRIYQQRQLSAQRLLTQHREHAYARIPRLRELDAKAASTAAAMGKAALSGGVFRREELKSALQKINQERSRLLKVSGLPEDYLTAQPECSLCNDTGFITDPQTGRTAPCKCFARTAASILYTQSGLEGELGDDCFEKFDLDFYPRDLIHPKTGKSARANMEEILSSCLQFVRQFDQIPQNLLFYGDTGLGKTYLSHCIARRLLDQSHSVFYFSSQNFFDLLAQNAFDRTADDEAADTSYVNECDLLIIDDLGTELTNTFVTSRLFYVLNERLRQNRSTLISTNLPLSSIAQIYSERTFSRITEHFLLMNFFGKDIRIQKKLSGR